MLDQRKMCVLCKCRCVWLASAKEGVWFTQPMCRSYPSSAATPANTTLTLKPVLNVLMDIESHRCLIGSCHYLP